MGNKVQGTIELGLPRENRFLMAVAIAKRAKQLKEGVRPLVPFNREEDLLPIEVALREVGTGKVQIVVKDKQEIRHDFLDEMDQLLDSEIEGAVQVEEEKKMIPKDKKLKKSLAA